MIQKQAILLPVLTILSIQGIIASVIYFNDVSDQTNKYLVEESGRVAGVSSSNIVDLSLEIPMMPEAEIVTVDTSINSASVTLESKKNEEEIKTYYEDYMILNNWEQIGQNTYFKDEKTLTIEISENIIKLNLISN